MSDNCMQLVRVLHIFHILKFFKNIFHHVFTKSIISGSYNGRQLIDFGNVEDDKEFPTDCFYLLGHCYAVGFRISP